LQYKINISLAEVKTICVNICLKVNCI